MSYLTMATRTKLMVIALAFLIGRTVAAGEDSRDGAVDKPLGLTPSEITFADALSHYCRGLIAAATEPGSKEALLQLEEAFKLNPGQFDTTVRLAIGYQMAGRTNDMLHVLQTGCERNPDNVGLRFYCAGVYQANRQYDKALAEYGLLIKRYPRNAAGYFGKAQTYLLSKDEEMALSVLGEGVGVVTNSESLVSLCREFGIACLDAQEWDRAVKCFTMIRIAKPDDFGGFLSLLDAYLLKGDKEAASALLKATPAKYLDNSRFDFVVARHLLAAGSFKEAMAYFEKIEKKHGPLQGRDGLRDAVYYQQYGTVCERAGEVRTAEKLFEKSVEMDARNDESLNYLAYMWAERSENLDQAIDYARRALAESPANPAYLDTLGWIYFKQGKLDLALEHVGKAHELMPEEAVISEHMGDILLARKETEKAVAFWKESFAADPDSDSVAKKLKEHGFDVEKLRKEAMAAKKKAGTD